MRRALEHYNLDMIISVGYRVNSHVGVHFRRWATERLREYTIKGFVLDLWSVHRSPHAKPAFRPATTS